MRVGRLDDLFQRRRRRRRGETLLYFRQRRLATSRILFEIKRNTMFKLEVQSCNLVRFSHRNSAVALLEDASLDSFVELETLPQLAHVFHGQHHLLASLSLQSVAASLFADLVTLRFCAQISAIRSAFLMRILVSTHLSSSNQSCSFNFS